MKKVIAGFLAGVIVTAAGTAYADDIVQSVVGKQVQGETSVTVNGTTLGTKAAIVDGSSYLPVRAVADSLKMDVTYDPNTGVQLTQKGATTLAETPQPTPTVTPTPTEVSGQTATKSVQEQIDDLNNKIADEKSNLEQQKGLLQVNENFLKDPNFPKESVQKAIDGYNQIISEVQQRISDYESQLAALKAQQ